MTGLTLATLRTQARRYVGPGLAIVLGVAFVAATLTLGATLTESVRTAVAGDLGSWAAVAAPDSEASSDGPASLPERARADVEALPQTGEVVAERRGILVPDAASDVLVVTTPGPGVRITSGRLPAAPGEVTLSDGAATSLDLATGSRFSTPQGTATVVGTADPGDASGAGIGIGVVYGVAQEVTTLTGVEGWTQIRARAADGVSDAQVVTAVGEVLGRDAQVTTGAQAAQDEVDGLTSGRDIITGFLLAFAAIALLVSSIVIANTFSVLLARRARETAMLRAVGATRGQVLRSALLEAVVLGVVASLVGVGVGVLAARGLAALSASAGVAIPLSTFTVPWSAALVPTVVGVLVTTGSALLPVLRSSRITPMAALRPDLALTTRSRRGRVRIALGLVGVVGGGALLALGALAGILPVGVLGGAASFVGVLLAGSVLVPPLARAIGVLPARLAGVPGELALDNTVRQPARTASTASALLVGVTLVVMMSVGAATAQSSIATALDDEFSVDVAVTATGADLSPDRTQRLAAITGVDVAADLPGTTATVGDSKDVTVLGVPAGAADAVRDDAFGAVRDGSIVTSATAAEEAGVRDGDRVTVDGSDGSEQLTVVVSDAAAVPFAVTPHDLDRLAPDAGTRTTLLRLAPDTDPAGAVAAAKGIVSGTGAAVTGGAPMRAQFEQLVDTSLSLVTALLAVSIVIAVVGIGTSLSLSVIERTRELGLVRALGLTRGQLRGMLAGEAVLLAVVATLLGAVLGTAYGVAGPMSLFGRAVDVTPVLPWGRLGLVGLAAVVCGLVAAVLPARRGVRIAPATALAEE